MSESTDEPLIQRIAAQDGQSWDRLFDVYGPLVYFWGISAGLSVAKSCDLVESVLLTAHSNCEQLTEYREWGVHVWLLSITREILLGRIAIEGDGVAPDSEDSDFMVRLRNTPLASSIPIEVFCPVDEIRRLLHRLLHCIRDDFDKRTWSVFWKSVVQDQPITEIAVDAEISETDVRKAIVVVLRRVRQETGSLFRD